MMSELALKDYEHSLDIAKLHSGETMIPPIVIYMRFYEQILNLMESDSLNPESYRELTAQLDGFIEAAKEAARRGRNNENG